MDDGRKKMLRVTAEMEGQSVIVRNLGRKVKLSQMELICLCNFAKLGLLDVFSELDGHAGHQAAAEIDLLREAIRRTFANKVNPDGLARLGQSCVAILSEPRLARYIICVEDEPEETADGQ